MSVVENRERIREDLKEYYGTRLKDTPDIQTRVLPQYVRDAMAQVHCEVQKKCYGCGPPVAEQLENLTILDLGCGAGHDCFVLSKLVGEGGKVIGVDMTEDQLQVARKHITYHTDKFGYREPNVQFVQAYIESLGDAGFKDNSIDMIISNCTVCLTTDKRRVLMEVFRLLRNGGEFYFSDMYADKKLPESFAENKDLWAEGLAGSLFWYDLITLAKDVGFCTARVVGSRILSVSNAELAKMVDGFRYASITYRLFKIQESDRTYGTAKVTYNGGIREHLETWPFDRKYTFKRGEPTAVPGDVASALRGSRFKEFVTIEECYDDEAVQDDIENPFDDACEMSKPSCCL